MTDADLKPPSAWLKSLFGGIIGLSAMGHLLFPSGEARNANPSSYQLVVLPALAVVVGVSLFHVACILGVVDRRGRRRIGPVLPLVCLTTLASLVIRLSLFEVWDQ